MSTSSGPFIAPLEPARWVIPNGLTVLHHEAPAGQLFSAQLWVKTGSIHEGPLLGSGLSHFLEHMLFKGTEKRGALDISREIHAMGGYVNAYTTFDRTVYYIDGPAEQLETALDILADMGTRSALPTETLRTERDVILREIDMGLDDPDRQLFRRFISTAFKKHPYRQPVIGHRELFEEVSDNDLRGYYQGRYAPNNFVLVLTGAFTEEMARDLAENYFGEARRRRLAPAEIEPEPAQLAARRETTFDDVNIVRGLIGFKVPGLAHADSAAIEVLARILGHGQSSLLWQELREKQKLVHHIDASVWNPGDEGLLWISYTGDPGKREAVEEAVESLIPRIPASADGSAVDKAVRQALVAKLNARKTVTGLASQLGMAEVGIGELGYLERHQERLQSVSSEAVVRAASSYLQPFTRTMVAVEPEPATRTQKTGLHLPELPEFEMIELKNGVRLLLQPGGEVPKVHLRLAMLGGPLWEPRDKRGITGVLATLLTRDAAGQSAEERFRAVEQRGASFTEFVGNNSLGLSLECLSEDFAWAAQFLGESIRQHAFSKQSFELERDAQMAALREEDDEALDYARRRLRAHFFGEHPYATDYLGHLDDLAGLTLDETQAMADRLLVGANVDLSVTGQFEPAEAREKLAEWLSEIPAGKLPLADAPFAAPSAAPYREHRPQEQAIVIQAFPDLGVRSGEDYRVGEIVDELASGMSSQLFERVREQKGLAYFVSAQRMSGLDCGFLHFFAGTHPQAVDDVFAEFDAEVERFQRGDFLEGELDAARTRLKVQRRQSRQNLSIRAMQAALDTLYVGDPNRFVNYEASIDAVTAERVQNFARDFLSPEHRIRYALLPEE